MGDEVFFAVADLFNLQVDVLFFDTTSTSFQRDTEEPSTEQVLAGGLRWYGHSRDSGWTCAADRDGAGRHP